ncbi:MAG: DUF4407 domain-containing protein [Saprospiraceae bacterium]
MKTLKEFFLFCSGTDADILAKCPSDENKYTGIGATVFFTGVLAFFSSSYALYTVFESYFAAIAFGLIWGLMIFNLDRYIVMSMKSRGRWYRDFFVALPRLGLAVLLALVISKPLEMKIFDKEIQAELIQMEQEVFKAQEDKVQARYAAQINTLQTEVDGIKKDLDARAALRDTLSKIAIQEADGTGGSGKKNLGPIYRAKKLEADRAEADLLAFQATALPAIKEKEAAIEALRSTAQTEISALNRTAYNGLAARMEALDRLGKNSAAIWFASMFITLLFIAIETAPIFVKLISSRSPYDYLLHQHEHVFEMANLEETTMLSNEVNNKIRFDTETGAYLVQARIKAEKERIDAKLKERGDNNQWSIAGSKW